jgi:hypothetical protein
MAYSDSTRLDGNEATDYLLTLLHDQVGNVFDYLFPSWERES